MLGSLAIVLVTTVFPLAAYTLTLGLFGLPHVASELRYVDRRFGRAWPVGRIAAGGVLLAMIVGGRIAGLAFHLPPQVGVPLELTLVAALALVAARGSWGQRMAAVVLALVLGGLILAAPFETSVGFSVLHNLTPLGFLWQLTPRTRRWRVMSWALAAFIGAPLLAGTGLLRWAIDGLGGAISLADPLGTGGLGRHFFVYVPEAWQGGAKALNLFTASVIAQQMHYIAVIVVLPALLQRWAPESRGRLAWPTGLVWGLAVIVPAALLFGVFVQDFAGARSLYGLAASVHAWIEIPVLIAALFGAQPPRASPTASETALAAAETARA